MAINEQTIPSQIDPNAGDYINLYLDCSNVSTGRVISCWIDIKLTCTTFSMGGTSTGDVYLWDTMTFTESTETITELDT